MKRILLFLCAIFFTTGAGSTGISANDTTANCDNNTLGQTSGTANVEIDWVPNTISIRWYDGNGQLSVPSSAQTCVYGNNLNLPTTQPTKTGYTFKGWTVVDVPAGYTKLEYLQSSGTQWIDTGIFLNSNSKIETKFNLPELNGNYAIFGASNGRYYNDGEISFFYHPYNNGIFELVLPSSNSASTVVRQLPLSVNTDYTMSVDKSLYTLNNSSYAVNWYKNYQGTKTCYIFTTSRADRTELSASATKIYYFTIYDNNTMVFNGIPARRNSDGEIGMYDTVSGEFFTNAGTGDFIAGPIFIPDIYTRLEYIESTNGQYINTGVTLNVNSKIETKFMAPTYLGNYAIFGASNGGYFNDGEISLFYNTITDYVFDPVNPTSNTSSNLLQRPPFYTNTEYTISYDKNVLLINDDTYQSNWYSSYQGQRTCFIFGSNRGATSWLGGNTRVYYFKIYNNGSWIRDMIPVRRNSDSALGMYDSVSGEFFINRGTGSFIAGPVVQ